jgi:alkylation response protein AidB-like acyl-CoA dehydrogenase
MYVLTYLNIKMLVHVSCFQGKIADMYTALSASRNYLYNVSRACDKGHVCSKDCAGVLLFAAENSVKVALDTIQCLGNRISYYNNRVYCHEG